MSGVAPRRTWIAGSTSWCSREPTVRQGSAEGSREARYDRASPFRVRWSVDGVATERNFPLEEDADAFRETLEKAVADGVRWNARTLLPATKVDARKLRVAEWCQEFYRADAPVTSAPNSRAVRQA